MTYRLLIRPSAQRELAKLPKRDYAAVRDAIRALADNPRPAGCIKLSGREGWRIRQGDYRVIYEIDDQEPTVTVLRVRHRRDVYE